MKKIIHICQCGCGKEIPWQYWHQYGIKKYYPNHYDSGAKKRGVYKKEITSVFSGYDRSKKIIKERNKCSWEHIGHCKGMIDVCHINQNPLDNNRKNLIVLCRSHHRLMDNGKIDYGNPKMPEFYVDKGGKRRYIKTKGLVDKNG